MESDMSADRWIGPPRNWVTQGTVQFAREMLERMRRDRTVLSPSEALEQRDLFASMFYPTDPSKTRTNDDEHYESICQWASFANLNPKLNQDQDCHFVTRFKSLPELTSKIFELAINNEPQTLMRLTNVCHGWREFLISTPLFWQHFILYGRKNAPVFRYWNPQKLQVWHERSDRAFRVLTINCDIPQRIQSFYEGFNGWENLEELRFCVDEHIPSLPDPVVVVLTNLKVLRVAFRNRDETNVNVRELARINCPNLQELEVEGLFSGIAFPTAPHLETLIVRLPPGYASCTPTVLSAFAQYRLSLENLSITGSFVRRLVVGDPVVVMSNLKNLRIRTDGEQWLGVLKLECVEKVHIEACRLGDPWMHHWLTQQNTQGSLREFSLLECHVEEHQLELLFQRFVNVTKVMLEDVEIYSINDPLSISPSAALAASNSPNTHITPPTNSSTTTPSPTSTPESNTNSASPNTHTNTPHPINTNTSPNPDPEVEVEEPETLTSKIFYSYWSTSGVFPPSLQHIEFRNLFTRNGAIIANLVLARREKYGGSGSGRRDGAGAGKTRAGAVRWLVLDGERVEVEEGV